ncbi:hypothetical protein [Acidianus manzaensis]|uniref:Uncharacterized protein n=1 Tax=Acidianus manzaensis TaxID=282676 RepID=A0A1W6K284_9CREN|nr:hypothetical protein [Acidianus manzaensis]ARM76653.1 hypothetical protein B6F84_11935 [Acidianus manzaensis]
MQSIFAVGLSTILFVEAIVLYFIITSKYEKIVYNWGEYKDKYLLDVFSSLIDFISSDEIIEQSLINSTLDLKSDNFKEFLETKIKEEKDKILKISKSIENIENIEKDISKILSHIQSSKYLNIAIIPLLISFLLVPYDEISNLLLGISLGLELISIYFSLYSYFIYKLDLKRLKCC